MAKSVDQFQPGQRVQVTAQIPQRQRVWVTRLTGKVVRYKQGKTGSWYAHSRDGKLWLDRLIIEKDDGEIVICILDAYTHVELLPDVPASSVDPAPAASEDSAKVAEPAGKA